MVRSLGNMQGLLQTLNDKTAEDLTEDGWLHTGDVGEIDAKGRLRITGRVNEIFKTEKGKYVAPAPIENRIVTLPGLELACVIGQGMPQELAPGSSPRKSRKNCRRVLRRIYSPRSSRSCWRG